MLINQTMPVSAGQLTEEAGYIALGKARRNKRMPPI
jgi:hypothetical protein